MQHTITITFNGSPIEAEKLRKACQKLADIPEDDRKRFIEAIENPKTAKALKEYWAVLKKFA